MSYTTTLQPDVTLRPPFIIPHLIWNKYFTPMRWERVDSSVRFYKPELRHIHIQSLRWLHCRRTTITSEGPTKSTAAETHPVKSSNRSPQTENDASLRRTLLSKHH